MNLYCRINIWEGRNILEKEKEIKISTVNSTDSSTEEQKARNSLVMFMDIITESTEQAVKAMHSESKLDNVGIFVDYDNVYWTLMNNYSHDPNDEDPNKNLFVQLWERYKLDNVRTFRVYADFQKVRTNLTSLQKKRVQIRHVYSNGKNEQHRKNSSDIELCIDAIESTYKEPNITCYVFVTADSDMIPILSRMMYKGKRVELFYLSDAAPQHVDITNYAHYSQDLLDFLNVEIKNYNIEDYVNDALKIINNLETKNKNTDMYLGTRLVKTQFTKELQIPEKTASELLEKLKINKLIVDDTKELSNGTKKQSITLTPDGKQMLQTSIEVATGEEKN